MSRRKFIGNASFIASALIVKPDLELAHRQEHAILNGALRWQTIFRRLAGYEDTSDPERLSVNPTMRNMVGGRTTEHTAASPSKMGAFETEVPRY